MSADDPKAAPRRSFIAGEPDPLPDGALPKAAPSLADELTQRMNALRMNVGDQKTSVEDEKDVRTADEKAARIAAAEVEAASIRAMMNRVVRVAPSLADDIVTMLANFPDDDMVITAVSAREALAALRAVEAVREYRVGAVGEQRIDLMLEKDAEPQFNAMSKIEQLRILVRSAVLHVYGCSWTSGEHRDNVAAAAVAVVNEYEERLNKAAGAFFDERALLEGE